MTWFIADRSGTPALGPDLPLAGMFEGIVAAVRKAALKGDANLRAQREVRAERDALVLSAARRLGLDGIQPLVDARTATAARIAQQMGLPYHAEAPPASVDEALERIGSGRWDSVLDLARQAAAADPAAWADLDLTDEGIESRVNERLQAEHRDLAGIVQMMPSGQGVAEFIGGIVGTTADVRNIPFLAFGFGGGTLRAVIMREASLNMAAEAFTMPSQFDMAERLEIEDPNVVEQLAIAGVAGGILGGTVEALARGFTYWRGRNALKAMEDDPLFAEELLSAAESALEAGGSPVEAQADILRRWEARGAVAGAPEREPLIGDEWDGWAPDDMPEGERLEVDVPPQVSVENPPKAASEPPPRPKRPSAAKPQSLRAWIKSRGGIRADDPMIGDVLAMNLQRQPGMVTKRGADMDSITTAAIERGYLPEGSDINDLLVALDKDARSTKWDRVFAQSDLNAVFDWRDYEAAKADADRFAFGDAPPPDEVFVKGQRAADGFFVEPGAYAEPGSLEAAFDDYLAGHGFTLLPREREEILSELRSRGGDGEYLVEQALSRELEPHEYASLRSETGEAPAGAGGKPAGQGAAGAPAGDRAGAGERGDPGGLPREFPDPRPAGLTSRQRSEIAVRQQQSKIGRLDQVRVEGEDGNLFSPKMDDLLDDPGGPRADATLTAQIEGLRDDLAVNGDFKVDMGDGPKSAAAFLRELDGDREFNDMLGRCGKVRTTE